MAFQTLFQNLQKEFVEQKEAKQNYCRKHNVSNSTKLFASENLTPMNESIASNCRKLKRNELIYGCFSKDGTVRIKREERARPVKVFHRYKLHQLLPDFDFGDTYEDDDIFLDASQAAKNSTQSSYYCHFN